MICNSDFEKFWFLYKTEGGPKGESINAFCLSRGVNYSDFNKWFRKVHKPIVSVEIESAPEDGFKETVEGTAGSTDIYEQILGSSLHVSERWPIQHR